MDELIEGLLLLRPYARGVGPSHDVYTGEDSLEIEADPETVPPLDRARLAELRFTERKRGFSWQGA